MIQKNPNITREKIADITEIAPRTISRELEVLKKLFGIKYDKTEKKWNM